jgi:uncharacterized protein YegL
MHMHWKRKPKPKKSPTPPAAADDAPPALDEPAPEPNLVGEASALAVVSANPQSRVPTVLGIDTSGSVVPYRSKIQASVAWLGKALTGSDVTAVAVEVAGFTISEPGTELPFGPPDRLAQWHLPFGGMTPLGRTLSRIGECAEGYLAGLARDGIPFNRGAVVIVSDGIETVQRRDLPAGVRRLREAQRRHKQLEVFPIATAEGANFEVLNQLSLRRRALLLDVFKFDLFAKWLFRLLSTFSESEPGDDVDLPPTRGDEGWEKSPGAD